MLETKDLLKKIREEYGYSVYEMGEKLGVSQTQVNQLENGNKNITEKYIMKVCEVFPTYKKQLMKSFYLGQLKKIREKIPEGIEILKTENIEAELPLYIASAGTGLLAMDEDEKTIKLTLPPEIVKIKNIFSVIVHGDSMLPEYRDRDVLILDPNFYTYVELADQDVVIQKNGERYIKQLRFKNFEPYLYSYNEIYPPIPCCEEDEVKILGVVIFMQRKKKI
ncbi:LexA family transcriptional regulator [Sebaldella sp. S0638]|uniref:LexA family protein n=1 Tax=Sebaldella sp. S0638 TaxID=2957809 RepID=UPI00209D9126|nr:LexA family transcriptional regulator [Sebaldella sp. S0638]MCP1226531.1 LexA family transcriptional regulator [Sebaldella sp. S0638]